MNLRLQRFVAGAQCARRICQIYPASTCYAVDIQEVVSKPHLPAKKSGISHLIER